MKETIDLSAVRKTKTQQVRTPPDGPIEAAAWSGDLDAQVLRGEVKGELLFAALQSRARQLGHSIHDMCRFLNFSYPYYSQLRSGRRSLSGAADEFTLACAQYLGIPRLTVLALAGIVTLEDMYPSKETITADLPRAFEYVCTDTTWAPLCTMTIRNSPPHTQYLIVRLYEEMAKVQLLPPILDTAQLAAGIVSLQAIQANLKQ